MAARGEREPEPECECDGDDDDDSDGDGDGVMDRSVQAGMVYHEGGSAGAGTTTVVTTEALPGGEVLEVPGDYFLSQRAA